MLDQKQHRLHLIRILLSCYKNSQVGSWLGFKGGTAAYLFYDLPRFSVDLDFDLLKKSSDSERQVLMKEISSLVEKDYKIKDQYDKKNTLFWFLSYGSGAVNIKLEISKRQTQSQFTQQSFYGVQIPVMDRADMVANKLMALLERKKFANRDLFDVWYFLQSVDFMKINYKLIETRSGLDPEQLWSRILDRINTKAKGNLLQGMGELISEKQKYWVKTKLINEILAQIQMKIDV